MTELLNQLLTATIEMRKFQKKYSQMRDMVTLSEARHSERKVDKIILEIEKQKSSLASLL